MQSRNKFFDDMSQLMTNAMGVAQGAKTEAETAMKGFIVEPGSNTSVNAALRSLSRRMVARCAGS
jgi:hypothetical protein